MTTTIRCVGAPVMLGVLTALMHSALMQQSSDALLATYNLLQRVDLHSPSAFHLLPVIALALIALLIASVLRFGTRLTWIRALIPFACGYVGCYIALYIVAYGMDGPRLFVERAALFLVAEVAIAAVIFVLVISGNRRHVP